jgi:hypothetical protein
MTEKVTCLYEEFGDFVMLFALRTYKHRDMGALIAIATSGREAA